MITGIALLWYYIRIKTSDVDIRITRKLLDAFMRAVWMDSWFTEYVSGWEYTTSFEFNIDINFTQIEDLTLCQQRIYC